MLQNNQILKNKINELWDKFWSGGISNPLAAIEQITYLLFMKRLDDLDQKMKDDAEWVGEVYHSKFDGTFVLPGTDTRIEKKTLRWSYFRNLTADELLYHVQYKVFPFLKELDDEATPFTRHMRNAVFIIEKPALLIEAINIIEEVFGEIEKDSSENNQTFQDIQGDVYEMLLNEIASAGKNGQFRTPRHIIKLLSELVAPKLGQVIADPACGSGGFLLGVYQYMVTQLDSDKDKKEPDEDGFVRTSVASILTQDVKNIIEQSLYGYDIDVTMVRLGLMNLMMHGIDSPQIDYKDTLSKGYNQDNTYDIVMANPPFTGSIDKGDINENLKLNTNKTELLFIERIFNMLKIGGTAGVIVPQGVLFSTSKAFIETRKILMEKCELKAVITMPSGVFRPYAGVSTAILIFTKGGITENVWFYEMKSDGYTLDDRRAKLEGYGDLRDIILKYRERDSKEHSDRKTKTFFVPKNEIVAQRYNLNISIYKDDNFDEPDFEEPEVILESLLNIEKEIEDALKDLKRLL